MTSMQSPDTRTNSTWVVHSRMLFVFLLWSFWLSFEYLALGPNSFVRVEDNGDSYVPARIAQGQSLANGELSFWSPQLASGVDRLSSGLCPLTDVLFFACAPDWLAYGLVTMLQRFVAGYFTYRLLRDSFHLDRLSSFLGGATYSLLFHSTMDFWYSAGFTLFDGFALPGIPFVFWAMDRIDAMHGRLPYVSAVSLGVLFSLSSYYHFTIFYFPFIWYWFVIVVPKRDLRFWVALGLFTISWLVSEMPVVWASLLQAPLSHRADWSPDSPIPVIESLSDQLRYLREAFKDCLASLGIIFIAVCFAGLWRDRRFIGVVGALLFGLGCYFGATIVQRSFHQNLGFLSGFDFSRVRQLFPFFVVVAGGIGLHTIGNRWRFKLLNLSPERIGRASQIALATVAIALILSKSILVKRRTVFEQALTHHRTTTVLYRHPDIERLAGARNRLPPFRVATVADYYQHPSFVWAYGLEAADGYVNLYPNRYREFWEQVVGPLISTDDDLYNELHYWGNKIYLYAPSPYNFHPVADVSEIRFEDYYNLRLLSLANVRFIISRLPLEDESLTLIPSVADNDQHPWRNPSGLYHLLARFAGQPQFDPRNIKIYENTQVLPRFRLVGNVKLFETSSELLEALRHASLEQLKAIAYVKRDDATSLQFEPTSGSGGSVDIETFTSDRIKLNVQCSSNTILVIANSFNPFWTSTIDGQPSSLFPVNHAFQGVVVEAGAHVVVLQYSPPYALRFGD